MEIKDIFDDKINMIDNLFVDIAKTEFLSVKKLFRLLDLQTDLNNASGDNSIDTDGELKRDILRLAYGKYIYIQDCEDVKNIIDLYKRINDRNIDIDIKTRNLYNYVYKLITDPYDYIYMFSKWKEEDIIYMYTHKLPYYIDNSDERAEPKLYIFPTPEIISEEKLLISLFGSEIEKDYNISGIWTLKYRPLIYKYSLEKKLITEDQLEL